MGWKDRLNLNGKGSFRGVEFYVDAIESNVGRRNVLHVYPGRDKPFVEDLGLSPRRFRINAYVLGFNYMADRDKLRAALETEGPGELVHPYWGTGTLTVSVVGGVTIRETVNEGGMARLGFEVVEYGSALPEAAEDVKEKVEQAADVCDAAVLSWWENVWNYIGVIADVIQAAVNLVTAIASAINTIKGYVNAAMAVVDAIGAAIESVLDAITDLILLPGQLYEQLKAVVTSVVDAFNSIGDAWDSYFGDDETAGSVGGTPETAATGATPASGDKRVDIAMKTFRELAEIGDDWPDVTVPADEDIVTQQNLKAENQASLQVMFKTVTVIETARAIPNLPFGSYTKAVEARDTVLATIDELLEVVDDTIFGPLTDLRVAIAEHLAEASAELPRIVEHTPAINMPALVIAQHLYGDSRYEADIIARNGPRNPLEVPGSEPIEVLAYD